MSSNFRLLAGAAGTLALLASCGPNGFEPDMRGWFPGSLNTAEAAAAAAAPRPQPDSLGVISFPDYQVAVTRQGDTVTSVAARLGLSAGQLASYNALPADAELPVGSVLVLPQRVAGGTPAPAPRVNTTGQVTDPFAGQGVRQPDVPGRSGATSSTADAATATAPQPRQHVVVAGETAWSIARKYGVNVQDLAAWNGLSSSMTVRVGQRLLIPAPGTKPPDSTKVTTEPGAGSPTPQPPSASEPLPSEKTAPASAPAPKTETPDLGATRTAASGSGRFSMPVSGAIIRVYEKGKNDGIDIAAPSGTQVKAGGSGTVAAITRDTNGVPIVVVRHSGDLMTVYTGLGNLNVSKGEAVKAGQTIGTAGNSGFIHFEVRRGFDSVDPEDYLG